MQVSWEEAGADKYLPFSNRSKADHSSGCHFNSWLALETLRQKHFLQRKCSHSCCPRRTYVDSSDGYLRPEEISSPWKDRARLAREDISFISNRRNHRNWRQKGHWGAGNTGGHSADHHPSNRQGCSGGCEAGQGQSSLQSQGTRYWRQEPPSLNRFRLCAVAPFRFLGAWSLLIWSKFPSILKPHWLQQQLILWKKNKGEIRAHFPHFFCYKRKAKYFPASVKSGDHPQRRQEKSKDALHTWQGCRTHDLFFPVSWDGESIKVGTVVFTLHRKTCKEGNVSKVFSLNRTQVICFVLSCNSTPYLFPSLNWYIMEPLGMQNLLTHKPWFTLVYFGFIDLETILLDAYWYPSF